MILCYYIIIIKTLNKIEIIKYIVTDVIYLISLSGKNTKTIYKKDSNSNDL